MKDLLVQAVRRGCGLDGEPVIQLKTALGGGNTHSMLALTTFYAARWSWKRFRLCARSWMPPVEQDALIYGPIRVELLTHKVLAQGKFVRLAKMEYRLLCYLILHEGQVLSRQEILTNIWNLPPNVKTRTLDMHIHTLRKKLGLADYLETVLQVGYRLRSIGKKEESPR